MGQAMERDSHVPPYWLAEVQTFKDQLARAVVDDDFFRPVELERVDGWLDWMKRFVGTFGYAIDAWPQLWHLAKSIGSESLLRC
jgi:hypothetical protein